MARQSIMGISFSRKGIVVPSAKTSLYSSALLGTSKWTNLVIDDQPVQNLEKFTEQSTVDNMREL